MSTVGKLLRCSGCKEDKNYYVYDSREWQKDNHKRKCKSCKPGGAIRARAWYGRLRGRRRRWGAW